MTNLSANQLVAHSNLRNFFTTTKAGLYNAVHNFRKRFMLTVMLLANAALCFAIFKPYSHLPIPLSDIALTTGVLIFLCLALCSTAIVGYVPGALKMQHDFARIGYCNSAGETPYLVKKEQHGKVTLLTFYSTGFPLSLWVDKQLQIESALNLLIASIQEGNNRRTITLCCVPPDHAFDLIRWENSYANRNKDNLLVLGRGLTDNIIINIDKTPHVLIGGNTGSGKTVLLQCLLWQAILQADVVYVADFKGGVDFNSKWERFVHVVTDEHQLLALLDSLADMLNSRKEILYQAGASNITEYRQKSKDYMQRIIFSCDEVAELLDKTGADKERKELLAKIEARLSLIARQGRAFGIHLFLATQRPDATIIPGQIKNNLNIRICGRADTTLSTIIIGDGRATEQIPSNSQGRFLMDDGTVFQAFYFDNKQI